jgi:hypothetical protein
MIRNHKMPRPATAIACIALFFAVAGGSAIALSGKNTVDSGDIKKAQVKTSDLGNDAVTTKKIKKDAVRAADIQSGAVGSGEIRSRQVGRVDLAPAEPVHLLTVGELHNGGEGDCIWGVTSPVLAPFRPNPPGYYKDALGFVHLTGILFSANGPGGDGSCGGGPGEASEDSVAFILPEGYRPANDVITGGGGGGAGVIGTTPLSAPPEAWPAGAVINPGSGIPALLDNVVFEPASLGGGTPRRDSSGSARSGGAGSLQRLADLVG